MELSFSKYHGAGNDFIIIDNQNGQFSPTSEQVSKLCHRHFGIGADGLMLLEADPTSDFKMRYFNSDGYEATMCGNGGRCMVLFAKSLGLIQSKARFTGVDGEHLAEIIENGLVRLKMIDVNEIEVDEENYIINTGSPHFIQFVENLDKVDVINQGRIIRTSYNPDKGGVNVNFAKFLPNSIGIRTYERGVESETLACGTGAVATAIATNHWFNEDANSYVIEAKGGTLCVDFKRVSENCYENIWLEGPAVKVFDGVVDI